MRNLKEQKILLFGNRMAGYSDRIAEELKRQGALVDQLYYGYIPSFVMQIIHNIVNNKFYQRLLLFYHEKKLNSVYKGKKYDIILVINGKNMPLQLLEQVKKVSPNAEFILYIWDDMANVRHPDNFLRFFNKVFTYNPFDAEEYHLIYRPFFYSEYVLKNKTSDLAFVGMLQSNRLKLLDEIKKQNPGATFNNYIFSHFLSFVKRFSAFKTKIKEVHFKRASYKKYIDILSTAKAVIEIPHVLQKNITTRAIEALGTRTKLITTAATIKNFDFYNEDNVFILSNDNISDIQRWLTIPYKNYDDAILEKYSLSAWVRDIMAY
ncbi:MAG: hypothetical protein QM594_22490 [Niabella sp.]